MSPSRTRQPHWLDLPALANWQSMQPSFRGGAPGNRGERGRRRPAKTAFFKIRKMHCSSFRRGRKLNKSGIFAVQIVHCADRSLHSNWWVYAPSRPFGHLRASRRARGAPPPARLARGSWRQSLPRSHGCPHARPRCPLWAAAGSPARAPELRLVDRAEQVAAGRAHTAKEPVLARCGKRP